MKLLPPGQIRQLVEMAEQARTALGKYAGYNVAYDSTALQLLDEWIEHHLRQFPQPSQKMRLLWASFLGEVFRRRHEGEWVIQERDGNEGLIVLCPSAGEAQRPVDVVGQVNRRVAQGMAASLVLFYTLASIELKAS